jgi:glutamate synthase (ferredoxin)
LWCWIYFSLKGEKTNNIIPKALNILTCLEHRGAVSSDGKTGDGAGILIEIPHEYFVKQCDFKLPKPFSYAVGMVFLPQKINQLDYCVDVFEKEIKKQNLNILGWRNVPVNSKVVGSIAAKTQPVIKQVFIEKDDKLSESDFNTKLYIARKIAENEIYNCPLSQKKLFLFF